MDKRAAVHVGNLPNSTCLKEIFLLACCRMHGINVRGPGVGCSPVQGIREPWARSCLFPSIHLGMWEMRLGVQREKEKKNQLKMGKAALVKHLSAAWFLQTELGELRVQQPRELHARLMLTAIPQPKCTFQFCMSGWQICKTNDALLRQRPIRTCLGCHAEPGHRPDSRSLRQMAWSPPVRLSPTTGKNARLK